MLELPIAGVHSMQVTGRDEFLLIVSILCAVALPMSICLSTPLKCISHGCAVPHETCRLCYKHLQMNYTSVLSGSSGSPGARFAV
jgi:hypothetical protein